VGLLMFELPFVTIDVVVLYSYKVRPAQFALSGEESCVDLSHASILP
jgi:hypothetical protein